MLRRKVRIDLSRLPECNSDKFYPLFFNRSRFLVLVGGAGSGKSHFAAQKKLVRLVSEPGPHRFVIMRKVARTLRASVFQLFRDYIEQWKWTPYFNINKSDMTITFQPTGAQALFVGMDDQEKLKSIAGISGVWLEEATEFSEDDINQVNLRLRGYMPNYKQIVLTFNPISAMHHLKTRFFDCEPSERITTLRTTYLDNRFIDPEYKAELEDLRNLNPSWWKIYGQGEWGVMEGLIYTPPLMDPWPPAESFDDTFYGLDFGFNNPTALLRVDMKDGEPYLTELLYESNLTNTELVERLKGNPEKKIAGLIKNRFKPIYADAAEPGRIAELAKAGLTVKPADKGQGSVHAGIAFCQGLRIHSKPANANLNAEFGSYVWAVDKDGKATDEPVKAKDHCFIAGTMVETDAGPRPIETLRPLDRVLTRCGTHPVTKIWEVGVSDVCEYRFSNGAVLTSTAEHPAYVKGRGFVPISSIAIGDEVETIEGYQWKSKASCLTESHSGATLMHEVAHPATISSRVAHLFSGAFRRYIRKFGKAYTDQSQMDFTFTTRTEIPPTTIFPTLRRLINTSIYAIMPQTPRNRLKRPQENGLLRYRPLPLSGTAQKRVLNGISSTLKSAGLGTVRRLNAPVNSAGKNLCRRILHGLGFAIVPVKTDTAEQIGSITLTGNAPLAGKRLAPTKTMPAQHAPNPVVLISVKRLKGQPVYNLTVESPHEYFANGILVHNCMDATRYALWTHLGKRPKPQRPFSRRLLGV